jgi:hypothetical protein
MAAGVLAASFASGWLGHAARSRPTAEPATPRQATATREEPAQNSQPSLETPTVVDGREPASFALQPSPDDQLSTNPADLVRTVARLRIGDENTGTEVPILAGPGITEDWLRHQPPPVSEYGQVVFQRHGYQVDQRRRLITTLTPDGRRVTVPIDQVLIRYTGNQSL